MSIYISRFWRKWGSLQDESDHTAKFAPSIIKYEADTIKWVSNALAYTTYLGLVAKMMVTNNDLITTLKIWLINNILLVRITVSRPGSIIGPLLGSNYVVNRENTDLQLLSYYCMMYLSLGNYASTLVATLNVIGSDRFRRISA